MHIEDSCGHGLPASRCGICKVNVMNSSDREVDRLMHEDPTICNDCGASGAERPDQCDECWEMTM